MLEKLWLKKIGMINIQKRDCSQYFGDEGNVGENFGDKGDICAGDIEQRVTGSENIHTA